MVFNTKGDKIYLPIKEVLLCADDGDLARSKNQWNWKPYNAVLLPPLLMEAAILNEGLDVGDLLKIFSRSITEWVK